jgi:N-methylhydantoinase B
VGAALAGLSWRDGVDTGGWPWDLQSTMPNVEEHEWFYPIFYLWRRELRDSGGAGKFRGGNSAELAFIPHKTDRLTFITATGHAAVPPPGLFGGSPPSTTRYTIKRDARVRSHMSETGKMPDTLEDLPGKTEYLAPKSFNIPALPDDVFVLAWAGAGGYGDPLERDPEAVHRDLVNGNITADWAKQAYGVVFDQSGKLDKAATDHIRDQLRAGRLANAPKKEHFKANVDGARQVAEGLLLVGFGSEAFLACAKCHTRISRARDNYKLHCVTESHPVTAANPHILDPKTYIDDAVVFQTYVCPGCGLLLQTEILRPGGEPLWDLQLAEVKRK